MSLDLLAVKLQVCRREDVRFYFLSYENKITLLVTYEYFLSFRLQNAIKKLDRSKRLCEL